jgi:hypothetical protein
MLANWVLGTIVVVTFWGRSPEFPRRSQNVTFIESVQQNLQNSLERMITTGNACELGFGNACSRNILGAFPGVPPAFSKCPFHRERFGTHALLQNQAFTGVPTLFGVIVFSIQDRKRSQEFTRVPTPV